METRPLWRWPELCRALDLPEQDGPDITGLCIDSRRIQPGELFIALTGDPGPRFHASSRSERDGHDYVAHAFERGAAGALVHREVAATGPLLRVDDSLDGLWALARARRQALGGQVVAVTGSSGKTTVKTLLGAALGAFTTAGSLNNHLGVPLSLASAPAGAECAVFEVGTNHPGEIETLARLVSPTVALVLNVHPAHREFFADLDAIRTEKLSIFKGLRDKGVLILGQSLGKGGLPGDLSTLVFGDGEGADCRLLHSEGDRAIYKVGGQRIEAHVPGGGPHRALSVAAVLCVLKALGRDLSAATDLPDSLIPGGRGSERRCGGVVLVDDSYNANPASMRAALLYLRNDRGRTIAVLGEMLELGAESEAYHRGLAEACRAVDRVVAVGEGMRVLYEELAESQRWVWRETADDALLEELVGGIRAGDRVLVKGSNRVFWARQFADRLGSALEALGEEGSSVG
ncbi:MAG: UDP-N-acetylmuramoyl-tripeptide--D-alanyl-D-alanine ligase [Gammaproteobacteria bacterium]|nr:UDP-N-acetylmuramoyl-tripeptide--D-alanyl-D-alanine ligase [Gammaproteobacteria bacterium]